MILAKCPFCGGRAWVVELDKGDACFQVECECEFSVQDIYESTPINSIKAWNRTVKELRHLRCPQCKGNIGGIKYTAGKFVCLCGHESTNPDAEKYAEGIANFKGVEYV